jgi:hypothetical protein
MEMIRVEMKKEVITNLTARKVRVRVKRAVKVRAIVRWNGRLMRKLTRAIRTSEG